MREHAPCGVPNGSWGQLRLPNAATNVINDPTYIDIQQYFSQNVAWSPNGNLTVSTEQHGVWQWNGKTWTMVGGPIDARHTYSTGDIACDLGLKNQRIERMFVLPGGWLCAISDAYVCWVRKLS